MKKGWQTKKLGEVCEVVNGGTPKTGVAAYWDGAHQWVTPAEMGKRNSPFIAKTDRAITEKGIQNSSARLLPPFSVILSSRAPIGYLVINTVPMATNQGCKGLVPSETLGHKFLFYFLSSIVDSLNELGTGATFKELSGGKLKEVSIPLPPLPEQKRIVGILDEAFANIAAAKATAEQNLQNARALFESHLNAVFTQKGKGWVEMTLGEACVFRSGTTLPKAIEKPAGEIPYLKVADMNLSENLNGVTASSRYVNKCDVNASNLLPVGTTIFPKRGGAILTNKKRLTHRAICADLNIMGVTPKSGLLPEFLFNFFLRLDLREINNGSSIPQINNYSIEPLAIAFPESTVDQKAIVAKLDALSAETARLSALYARKLELLEELKKSLLHRAFAGEL